MRTLVRLATGAVCAVVVLAGCGTGGDTPAQTREALRTRVGVLVDAANAGDSSSARTALTALRADVSSALRLGSLSTQRAAELSRLVDDVEAALPERPPPSAPPTTAPPTTAPVEPSPPAPRSGAGAGGQGGVDTGTVPPDQGGADKGSVDKGNKGKDEPGKKDGDGNGDD